MHQFYSVLKSEDNLPVHVLYFDDLKQNSTYEMEKVLQFLYDNYGFIPDDKAKRLQCLSKE